MTGRTGLGDAEARRARLLRVLQSKPDEVACRACVDRLDDYVAAQLAGEPYAARYPEVAIHLDACPACANVYGRLYEVELAAASNTLPEPEQVPDPDLSFLLPGTASPLSPSALRAQVARTLTERLRAGLRRTGDRVRLQLSADLLPLLRPPPAVAAVRAPTDAARYGEVLLALNPDEGLRPDLPMTVTAYRDAHRPEECLVEVSVEPPGRSWPDVEGLAVALIVAGERREARTDAWGLAAFEGVPIDHLGDLVFEVGLPAVSDEGTRGNSEELGGTEGVC